MLVQKAVHPYCDAGGAKLSVSKCQRVVLERTHFLWAQMRRQPLTWVLRGVREWDTPLP
jgi:hypothetical protein